MPAVTPAELHTGPSCTKIGSDSTRTLKRRASSAQYDQPAVARRPSNKPDAARRNAPAQTEWAVARPLCSRLHPVNDHWIRSRRVDTLAAGHHQCVHQSTGALLPQRSKV